jgi:mono/diheme cytochrome c family protein
MRALAGCLIVSCLAVVACAGPQRGGAGGFAAAPPAESTSTQVSKGAAVYAAHCERCHGPDRDSYLSGPKLDDLGWSEADVRSQVRTGATDPPRSYANNMPAISSKQLTDADLYALTAYLRSIGTITPPKT